MAVLLLRREPSTSSKTARFHENRALEGPAWPRTSLRNGDFPRRGLHRALDRPYTSGHGLTLCVVESNDGVEPSGCCRKGRREVAAPAPEARSDLSVSVAATPPWRTQDARNASRQRSLGGGRRARRERSGLPRQRATSRNSRSRRPRGSAPASGCSSSHRARRRQLARACHRGSLSASHGLRARRSWRLGPDGKTSLDEAGT